MDVHDPFGEWRNPYSDELIGLLYAIEHLPPDYDASVAYIRQNRPSVPSEALRFWNTTQARAHAIVALLSRGSRSITGLHTDLGIGHDKLYSYLPRWRVAWRRRPDEATVQDPLGERFPVVIERWHDQRFTAQPLATVRLAGYAVRTEARWLPDAWEFRTAAALSPESLVTADMASRLLNLQQSTVSLILPVVALTAHRKPLLALADVERVLPPTEWRSTLEGVRNDLNPCRCAYWHAHTGTCGLQPERALPARGEARYTCEDHRDLT